MKPVLVACECSGVFRDALISRGVPAVSCDIKPHEKGGNHIQGDVLNLLNNTDWSGLVAFPPCTNLCVSGAKWFREKRLDGRQQKSVDFFLEFTKLSIPWAIENPVGIMSSVYKKPDSIVCPRDFGSETNKKTCFWLHELPPLLPTHARKKGNDLIHKMPPSKNRACDRSRLDVFLSEAMADQWYTFFK